MTLSVDRVLKTNYLLSCLCITKLSISVPLTHRLWGAGIACWESARLVTKSLQVRVPAGEFPCPEWPFCVLTFIWCTFHLMLPQRHVKDPGHSAKSADGRLHLNTHTPLTQWSQSGLTVLSRHSGGTYHWGKWAHTQLVRELLPMVISVGWAFVDWSLLRKWNR